jgi:alkylation response protein AidB-like acyl-CoA dehydrogenase
MAKADNFGFGEEAALLKESARKFFTDNFPTDALHALVATDPSPERMSDCAWERDLWQQLVDLGWSMLAVPESAGGVGMPLVAVAGLVEELGRAAFPCPLLGTLNATYVLIACGDGGQAALEEIAAGQAATLAITNHQGDWNVSQTEVSCEDGKLSGSAWFVQDARKTDRLLVSARSPAGLSLYWVATDAPGVSIHADAILDLTRDQAHISFDAVEAEEVTNNALAALEQAMPAIWIVLSADIVGAAEWQLQTTVEYASARQQFDHPLGFFQAVKHPLVDVMVQIDQSKSLVYGAACSVDMEPARALQDAHMAKASASETAAFASGRSIQCHGGIGFTWECFVHLYFKRQKHSQMLWGDAGWHRRRLADILIGEVA